MQFSDGAIAVVFAATLGGLISLLSLIISKEQTISQFRQAWIDSLRSEIAAAVAYVAEGVGRLRRFDRDVTEQVLDDEYVRTLHEKLSLIRLRLNPNDKPAPEILRLLKEVEEALSSGEYTESVEFWEVAEGIQAKTDTIVEHSQQLLKAEWERVKTGEPFFKYTRWVITAIVLLFIAVLMWAAFTGVEFTTYPEVGNNDPS